MESQVYPNRRLWSIHLEDMGYNIGDEYNNNAPIDKLKNILIRNNTPLALERYKVFYLKKINGNEDQTKPDRYHVERIFTIKDAFRILAIDKL